MKFTSVEIGLISLLLLGFLYFYNNPKTTVYKQKPVYYPVYENRYIPVNRHDVYRPRPFPHRPHRHHNHIHHDKPPINFTGGGIV